MSILHKIGKINKIILFQENISLYFVVVYMKFFNSHLIYFAENDQSAWDRVASLKDHLQVEL